MTDTCTDNPLQVAGLLIVALSVVDYLCHLWKYRMTRVALLIVFRLVVGAWVVFYWLDTWQEVRLSDCGLLVNRSVDLFCASREDQ